MNVIAWTEIESFHNIKKFMQAYPENLKGKNTVTYRGKVKLHGTNAAVQIHLDGTIVPQSRTTILTEGSDNAGFAKWVKQNEKFWSPTTNDARSQVIVYGEWIGPGIQKGVAVNSIPKRSFAVFAARPLDTNNLPLEDHIWVEPSILEEIVRGIPDTYVLPWGTDPIEIDWTASDTVLSAEAGLINQWVANIEANDPWVESNFGVKGTGEGLVFYPVSPEHTGLTNFNNLVFKAKGEKHKNINTASPAQVNPEVAANADAFVNLVLTEARLMQGVDTIITQDGAADYDMKKFGKFLAWVVGDVKKEAQDELEASDLTWDQVSKPLSAKVREWYLGKAKPL